MTGYAHVFVDWDCRDEHQAGVRADRMRKGGSAKRFGENSMEMSREMGSGRGQIGARNMHAAATVL
jgi:hypothetical protein